MKVLVGTTSLKRESFMQMIGDAKLGKFDLIVAKEVSRFSRDTIDSLFYTRELLEYDVCVYFLSDNIITASGDGELRLTIMSSMAQDEVRKISERTKFGIKRALEKGTVLGTNNIWGYQKNKGTLIIDETEAILVRTIFELYANNSKIGLRKLSSLLEEKGFSNHNHKPFHPNSLKRILQNPKYKGFYTGGLSTVVDYRNKKRKVYAPSEWKLYEDFEKVPPIVSEALWEKANAKLLERNNKTKGNTKYLNTYPLSGKLFCEKHHCSFIRKVKHYKTKNDEIAWVCSTYHSSGKKTCPSSFLYEKDLFPIFLSIFKEYEKYKEEIYEDLLSLYSSCFQQLNDLEESSTLEKKLQNVHIKKNKLLDLALDGIFSKEELSSKKLLLENEISEIQKKLEELKHPSKSLNLSILKNFILKNFEITNANLEDYIDVFIHKVLVKEKQLEIVLTNHSSFYLPFS